MNYVLKLARFSLILVSTSVCDKELTLGCTMFTYLSFFGIVEAAVQVQCTDTMIKGGSVEERLYK